MTLPDGVPTRVVGRYAIHEEIASGGMATVHFGRALGTAGFSRTVAIKCLHPHLARDPEFVKMFLDEARIAARIRHPNVVPVLDVVNTDGEIFLVMEYVAGASLARVARAARDRGERIPPGIAASLVVGLLRGLHAAHEATDERGQPLCIVHRDVSPQNIIVGRDGVAHVLDFGVAKAAGQLHNSRQGRIKGKVSYMPPEQVRGSEVTLAVDVYAAGVVFWELLTGERLFAGENEANAIERVLYGEVVPPSTRGAPAELDDIVMRAVSRAPEVRFPTAREMARAIEGAISVASTSEVGEWLEAHADALTVDRERDVSSAGPAVAAQAESGVRPSALARARSQGKPEVRAVQWRALGIAAFLVVLAGGVALEASRMHTAPIAPPASSPPLASAAPPPLAPPGIPAAEASVASAPSAAPSASASLAPRPAPRPVVAQPPSPAGGPKPPAVKPGCNPPYTVDADGVKQYKVQCL